MNIEYFLCNDNFKSTFQLVINFTNLKMYFFSFDGVMEWLYRDYRFTDMVVCGTCDNQKLTNLLCGFNFV
jgi:hypothetical protein